MAATYSGFNNTSTSGPVLILRTAGVVVATPEPASLLVLAESVAGLLGLRRRHHARAA